MSEKPRFWDFCRANRLGKYDEEQLYIYERKRGKRVLYNKLPRKTRQKYQFIGAGILLVICAAVYVPWFICWDSILFLMSANPEFLFVMYFGSQFIGNVIINKLIYARMNFEKISETDWDDAKESEYKKSKFWQVRFLWIIAGIWLLMVLAFGLTPVYMRYLADRALGTPWQAEVTISTSQYNKIYLDNETQPGEVFTLEEPDKDGKVHINIWTLRIPEQVKLYVNGKAVDYSKDAYVYGYAGPFWENRYFSIHIKDEILFNAHEGENTLELKSDNFYKKWTFTLEYK